MTLRKFLMWYLGGILFVGTAGASGYQVLSRQHAQLAAREAAAPSPAPAPPQAMAAAEPAAPADSLPQAAPPPAANAPPGAAVPAPPRRADALPLPPLPPHGATGGTSHASPPDRLAERRPATPPPASRPTYRFVTPVPAPPRLAPPMFAGQYAAPSQPVRVFVRPPPPAVTYYPYPGHPAYPRGYAYYYPRYQYYRVY